MLFKTKNNMSKKFQEKLAQAKKTTKEYAKSTAIAVDGFFMVVIVLGILYIAVSQLTRFSLENQQGEINTEPQIETQK